jgi:hypothetical protein
MSDLVMIVPSRGRPGNVGELLEVCNQTTSGNVKILIALDDDDRKVAQYAHELPLHTRASARLEVEVVTAPRLRLGGTLNKLAVERAKDHFAVGFMGDDHRPRTPEWDARLVDALHDLGTGLVYGNDLYQRGNLPTAVAMTSDIVTALGYMVPSGLTHLYVDDAWKALGHRADCLRYLPDVVIEHMHPMAGKAAWDDRYAEVNASSMYDADRIAFEHWQASRMAHDVAAVRALVAGAGRPA